MIKRLLWIGAGAILLLLFLQVDAHVRSFLQLLTFNIKKSYISIENGIKFSYEAYIDQARSIQNYKEQIKRLQRYEILYNDYKNRWEQLQKDCNVSLPYSIDLVYVRSISYQKFGDYTAVWLDANVQKDRIYGLLKGEYVAGIVIEKNGKALALLNGNAKCSYGVVIGEDAEGVAVGSGDNRYVIIKYIPNYKNFHVGQEVLTNGLDGIFIYGLKVGVVTKIWQEGSYKVAKVRTYADLRLPRFFWLMKL